MPVYNMTYRSYEGDVRRRFRWTVVMAQELRVLARLRPLQVLMLLPLFHIFLRVLQVVSFDTMGADPRNPIGIAVRNVTVLNIDDRMFFDFLRIQGPFVFLVLLLAGAGMIANDVRHNLLEVYFSKPLTWRDYVFGKAGTLIGLGLALTAVPALFFIVLHALLMPTLESLRQGIGWIPGVLAFSAAIVLPLALGVLACSAVFRSERTAGMAATLVLVVDSIFGNLFADLLHNRNLLVTALPTAIRRIGEVLFHQKRPAMELPWWVAALVVAAVCLGSLWLVVRAARRAEGNA